MTVVLRQGLWAWMLLVEAQQDDDNEAPGGRDSRSLTVLRPPSPPAMVPQELVAAWTDLVVGTVTRDEVHA